MKWEWVSNLFMKTMDKKENLSNSLRKWFRIHSGSIYTISWLNYTKSSSISTYQKVIRVFLSISRLKLVIHILVEGISVGGEKPNGSRKDIFSSQLASSIQERNQPISYRLMTSIRIKTERIGFFFLILTNCFYWDFQSTKLQEP